MSPSLIRQMGQNDSVIQALCGVGLKLEYCLDVIDESPAQVKVALADVLKSLDGLIEETRNHLYELIGSQGENG